MVGGVAALAVVIAMVWYVMMRRRKRLQERQEPVKGPVEPSELSGEVRAELASKLDL